MKIDIDPDVIEAIQDLEIQKVFKQFRENGFAVFSDDQINPTLGHRTKELRRKKLLLMAPDHRTDLNILAANPNISNAEKALANAFEDIIRDMKLTKKIKIKVR